MRWRRAKLTNANPTNSSANTCGSGAAVDLSTNSVNAVMVPVKLPLEAKVTVATNAVGSLGSSKAEV